MASKTIRQQKMRVRVARSEHHAHFAGHTALNGWARFHDNQDALDFVEHSCMEDVNCQVYVLPGTNQTSVDWSTRDRYAGNLQVADRTG